MKTWFVIAAVIFIIASAIGAYTTYTIHGAKGDPHSFPETTLSLIEGMYASVALCITTGVLLDAKKIKMLCGINYDPR